MSRLDHLPWSKSSRISRYGVALLSATAVLIISRPLFVHLGTPPGTFFLCAVMLSAWFGGLGPGLLATAYSALVFYYYFLPPVHSMGAKPGQIPRLVMYIIADLIIGFLSAAQRNAKESLRSARDDLKRTVEDLQSSNEALHAESRERKQAEEALRQAQAELARANRASSMGELTASIAHEVNQPIAAAIANAHACLRWLTRDRPDLDEACAAASRILKNGNRAGEIVNRVHLFFKKDTQVRELVDLNETIREMMLILHSEAIQYTVSVRADLAADLPQVSGDRVQLQQVLMNLMMNSIDAMKEVDGIRELTIQSQRCEQGQPLISVSDTGAGIPPQQADKIFEAFFTTKTHGTGIGLKISRSIVESHGGRLWAADNHPRGARFCFTLPANGVTQDKVSSGDHTESREGLHANKPVVEFMDIKRRT
ncbi:PAS domain-containing sensor histidine kinase [Acidicapsa acidisoli]|uniref:PAS domain-containing sensor histidine kinase n=1 Tax=Acidicapsa acidisoli TaxID=1615681 RepID=UPI0021DFE87B|nr:PAS domain-containing sensor histidine kinase [Acidicapsa acidisoli]